MHIETFHNAVISCGTVYPVRLPAEQYYPMGGVVVFIDIVLPVFLIVAVGWLFGRKTVMTLETPSVLTLYVFTPCLFFNSMIGAQLEASEYLLIFAYSAALFIVFAIIVLSLARLLGYPPSMRNALVLGSCFPNSGNFGLPIILFAFSQAGFDRALIFAIFQVFLVNSAGVFFASRSRSSVLQSMSRVLRFPGFIAVLLGVLLRSFEIEVPGFLLKPISLLGQAAIPTLLMMLGMQLGRIRTILNVRFIGIASFLKLIAYPLVGYLLVLLFFGGNDLTSRVLIVISAAPTGVSTTLLAERFGTEPELVSAVALVTTLVSLATVSAILALVT